MSYALLSYGPSDAEARAGIRVGDHVFDVARLLMEPRYSSVLGVLQDWQAADAALSAATAKLATGSAASNDSAVAGATLRAPVLYPGNIFAAGANYTDHIAEMARSLNQPVGPSIKELGGLPWHFVKTSRSAVVGPDATVAMPSFSKNIDWEIELAVVIGKRAKDVALDDALDYVAGYTIANDLSAREIGRAHTPQGSPFYYDWITMKCFDGACPLGPWIVPASAIADPQALGLKLWVNDELMQDSNTSLMIFSVAEQIAMLSSRLTLHPGDVILTGAPAGVGIARGRFLKAGDAVRMWIEGIGEMRHSMG